jgi:hypothetical protein
VSGAPFTVNQDVIIMIIMITMLTVTVTVSIIISDHHHHDDHGADSPPATCYQPSSGALVL